MTERILLVDYENVQAVDLRALPEDVKVRFARGGGRILEHMGEQGQGDFTLH